MNAIDKKKALVRSLLDGRSKRVLEELSLDYVIETALIEDRINKALITPSFCISILQSRVGRKKWNEKVRDMELVHVNIYEETGHNFTIPVWVEFGYGDAEAVVLSWEVDHDKHKEFKLINNAVWRYFSCGSCLGLLVEKHRTYLEEEARANERTE